MYLMHLGDVSYNDFLKMAKLPSAQQRSKRQLACLMCKRARLPTKYAQVERGNQQINTRSNEKICFSIPKPTCERFRSYPLYVGSQLWDTLNLDQQRAPSHDAFKNRTMKEINLNTYPV